MRLLELARAAYVSGNRAQVRVYCQQVLAIRADPYAEHYLGLMDFFDGDAVAGERRIRNALAMLPGIPMFHNNLGLCLRRQGRAGEAIAAFRAALQGNPDYLPAWGNLALELYNQGDMADALEAFERALALDARSPQAHFGRSQILLGQGDYARGWAEHEWRLQCPELRHKYALPSQIAAIPAWRGEDLEGKRLLLIAEQGLGDTLQFVRYVKMLAGQGAEVALYLGNATLRRLLESVEGLAAMYVADEVMPRHDYSAYLMSLPYLCGTRALADIPAEIPYLAASDARRLYWRSKLAGLAATGLRVGLAWAGNPGHANDALRSCPPAMLRGLFDVPATWVGLQVGGSGDLPDEIRDRIVDWRADLTDYAETAALIAELDLVISVDTSVAHAAGALGKPVWLMLGQVADWRWLRAGDDSPWYPTARLFRQPHVGAWDEVVAEIRRCLFDRLPGPSARSGDDGQGR
jgi:tetratricopeptide (TPR) repeat protein